MKFESRHLLAMVVVAVVGALVGLHRLDSSVLIGVLAWLAPSPMHPKPPPPVAVPWPTPEYPARTATVPDSDPTVAEPWVNRDPS